MAIMTDPATYAAPVIKAGPKTAAVLRYLAIGVVAIAIAVPAAMATGGAMFEECYSACAVAN